MLLEKFRQSAFCSARQRKVTGRDTAVLYWHCEASKAEFGPSSDQGPIFRAFFSAENSAEFLGKMIFQNFFRGKFNFFPTFFGENIPRNFLRNFPRKKCAKNRPQEPILRSSVTMPALQTFATPPVA
jgi:hypothetical protein